MIRAKTIASIVLGTTLLSKSTSFNLNLIAVTRDSKRQRRVTYGRFKTRFIPGAYSGRTLSTTLCTTAAPVDVLSSADIVNGTLIALVLAFTASFLQGRRKQNDFVLWEPAVGNATESKIGNKTKVFDGDAWTEAGRPENYVLYNSRLWQRQPRGSQDQKTPSIPSSSFPVERAWVIVGLLALFVPIFSIEFFFAFSRQVFCGSSPMDQPDWASYLCSPAAIE
jgi:hypothetical protein